ncbi:hypothetical protein SEVIR_2G105000v4 [Setaria viridis]|uniref:F-box domain-containing protein n=1 Tax=Setaria viridis TaxID=4556 RepID=A0A4U6VU37_SETVI|nr:putative F-box protein At5g52610 [Setaria viridis]XP_034578787.1 putative F-box protein At5g52610 [Setaria viridis]TKW31419.1 hypothetical protein SEVIR_2G105000v2 [Setaria viridis]TKW31420.1 hypothetical protein SEVIR_2G105000v2 [Setaria viridis]
MASPGPSSPPVSRSTRRRTPVASNTGVLPPDVLFDVLLRLPAKELCRLRAVCRAWRSLTVDPLFTGAHAARHPLFLANFRDDQTHICVVDLLGIVVKRIPNADGHLLLHTSLDLACATTVRNSCQVLDPATGNVHVPPESPAVEHLDRENVRMPYTSFAFGRIATTGEYKVIRIFNRPTLAGFHQPHLFEVFTINISGSSSGSSHTQWRARQPDHFFDPSSAIVVGEVVYFKVDIVFDVLICGDVYPGIPLDCILSFDLEREEWRGILNGPISEIFETDKYAGDLDGYRGLWTQVTLADLRGSLGLVHYRKHRHMMDLWVRKDIDGGLWVKEYIIQIEPIFPTTESCVKSLFMLDDGRLVIHFPKTGLLFIYDPRTNTSAQVEMRHLDAVAMYTGNLLSLQVGDMV